jgi:hypothetical protein
MNKTNAEEPNENLLEKEAHKLYGKYSEEFKNFLKAMEKEEKGTKEAFVLLHAHAFDGRELTKEEKKEIEREMEDVLKTVGLVGIAIMPGGSVVFILAKFLKFNKYILPSEFLASPDSGSDKKPK